MREQVCTYMCPWPRIQAAMIDEHSLQVTYRGRRGEPRGAHKKGATWEGRGDCVDCTQCVAVCPMGIDIRHGSQLECINCGLCIDACDEVMDRVDRPRGLIAYYGEAITTIGPDDAHPKVRFVRPRTVLYAALIAALGAFMLYGLITRPTIAMDIIRDRNPEFVRLSDGSVRNGYIVKILNMRPTDRDIVVSIEGVGAGAVLKANSARIDGRRMIIHASGDNVSVAHLYVAVAPAALAQAPARLRFVVVDPKSGAVVTHPSAFLREAN